MHNQTNVITKVLDILNKEYPTIAMHEVHGHDPFQMLIAVILSQRARDSVTVPTAKKLFDIAPTPHILAALPLTQIEAIIHPIGFSAQKATSIQEVAAIIDTHYGGHVPSTEAELLSLPRVGRKTANIILTTFFGTTQIAVDVHVHRITNRLGWITTTKPEQTEKQLTAIIPKPYQAMVNRVFVAHGQTICLPRVPRCLQCPVRPYCKRIGVATSQ